MRGSFRRKCLTPYCGRRGSFHGFFLSLCLFPFLTTETCLSLSLPDPINREGVGGHTVRVHWLLSPSNREPCPTSRFLSATPPGPSSISPSPAPTPGLSLPSLSSLSTSSFSLVRRRDRDEKRVSCDHGRARRRGSKEIHGAGDVSQSPSLRSAAEDGGRRVWIRSEGSDYSSL